MGKDTENSDAVGGRLHPLVRRRRHELKTLDTYFQAIETGEKRFEIRFNDREFQRGDTLYLRETTHSPRGIRYTGRECEVEILYATTFEQKQGWIVLSITTPKMILSV